MKTLNIKVNTKEQEYQMSLVGLFYLVVFAYLASGCGASTTTVSNASSSTSLSSTSTITSTNMLATCNHFSATGTTLDGKVQSIANSSDYMRLRITGITSQFDNNSNIYVKFFRWKTNSDGTSYIDSNPLTFHMSTPGYGSDGNGGNVLSDSSGNSEYTTVNVSNLKTLATNNYESFSSSSSFLNSHDFILHGLSIDWKVVKIALFSSGTSIASADILLPSFAANPTTYAAGHTSLLYQLHPFYGQTGQVDQYYMNGARGFCIQ